jgi:hypothetical protein
MKAYLSFKLPEEQEEFKTAQDGWKWSIVYEGIMTEFRKQHKYAGVESWTYDEIIKVIIGAHDETFE